MWKMSWQWASAVWMSIGNRCVSFIWCSSSTLKTSKWTKWKNRMKVICWGLPAYQWKTSTSLTSLRGKCQQSQTLESHLHWKVKKWRVANRKPPLIWKFNSNCLSCTLFSCTLRITRTPSSAWNSTPCSVATTRSVTTTQWQLKFRTSRYTIIWSTRTLWTHLSSTQRMMKLWWRRLWACNRLHRASWDRQC